MPSPPVLLAALALAGTASAQSPDGATLYQRCAACHLPDGAGVPGAFPPLRADFAALAARPAGRRYLVLAVTRGLAGPLLVEGKPYRGVMPAQSLLDDAGVAAVLNHVAVQVAKAGPGVRPFTPAEVAAARAGGAALTAAAVAALHASAAGQ